MCTDPCSKQLFSIEMLRVNILDHSVRKMGKFSISFENENIYSLRV